MSDSLVKRNVMIMFQQFNIKRTDSKHVINNHKMYELSITTI